MSKETFCVGDVVTWEDSILNWPDGFHPEFQLAKKYGEGPFRITKVIEVPTGPHDDDDFSDCIDVLSLPLKTQVGHHQWVEIEGMISPLDDSPKEWSGAWFKKVEPNTGATP